MNIKAKLYLKHFIRSLIYRFPPVYLSPAGQHSWLEALVHTNELQGDVLEIGCYLGGTAALGARLLEEIGSSRRYIVLDTFGGFVQSQFADDVKIGGWAGLKNDFSANNPELARWVMDKHGGAGVRMIVGDITTLADAELPEKISACLIDVDLVEPIYVSLKRVYPRLVAGGIIIVDDCGSDGGYKARIGYDKFIEEHGLPSEVSFGKGIIRKSNQPSVPLASVQAPAHVALN